MGVPLHDEHAPDEGETEQLDRSLLGAHRRRVRREDAFEPGVAADVVITVPGACLEASAKLEKAPELIRQSVGSVRDFDPDRIVELLNRLQTLDQQTRPLLKECSDVQVDGASPSATVTASAEPTS